MNDLVDRNYLIARMSQRAQSAEDWIKKNPILADGEIGVESDTHFVKIGDGQTVWQELPYQVGIDINYYAGNGIIITENREIQATLLYEVRQGG